MKKIILITWALSLCAVVLFCAELSKAADSSNGQRFEYATIHWAGRDNTHVTRPGGKVEFAGAQLAGIKRPERADDRAFYMNVVVNALAKEGYELAAMTSDDIVMKRLVVR